MNRVRAIDRGAMRAVAEAGVVLQTLHEACARPGIARFPLTLGAKGSATIGGLISTNAGGTQVLRFGPMRALVDGIEAVLPDGIIHNGLSGLKRIIAATALTSCWSEPRERFGIVTAARLRLRARRFYSRAVAWLGLGSPQKALDTLCARCRWKPTGSRVSRSSRRSRWRRLSPIFRHSCAFAEQPRMACPGRSHGQHRGF